MWAAVKTSQTSSCPTDWFALLDARMVYHLVWSSCLVHQGLTGENPARIAKQFSLLGSDKLKHHHRLAFMKKYPQAAEPMTLRLVIGGSQWFPVFMAGILFSQAAVMFSQDTIISSTETTRFLWLRTSFMDNPNICWYLLVVCWDQIMCSLFVGKFWGWYLKRFKLVDSSGEPALQCCDAMACRYIPCWILTRFTVAHEYII